MHYYIDPIRLHTDDTHNVFFVSDTHFGHNKDFLYGKRGFKNIYDHDDALMAQWNSKVSNTDTVIHCGDFMFGEGGYDRIMSYLQILKFGQLYIMPGNHHAGLRQLHKRFGVGDIDILGLKNVNIIPNYMEFVVNGQPIIACHYPIASWNGMGKGTWMVSGHCHGSFPGSNINNLDGKIIDVGYESAGLVSFQELKELMDKRSIKLVDHHNSSTSTALH